MKKLDQSIRKITLASVKRSLMQNAICKHTNTFEPESMEDIKYIENAVDKELPVACTFSNEDNFTFITTRRVITQMENVLHIALFQDIKSFKPGDFKGLRESTITLGSVITRNEDVIPVYIETGKPSMIMIYAIQAIINLMEKVSL